jgi:hypothetical protein
MNVSSTTGEFVEAMGQEKVTPHPDGLIHALREIGYKFNQAIADLVDNSITAEATCILIRFITKGDSIAAIVVADDGVGMEAEILTEAMRLGAKDIRPRKSLGKYGVGLKLASLSHARCLTVYSRKQGIPGGRRWKVADGWVCTNLQENACANQLDSSWGPLNMGSHGTIVEWSDIDKLVIQPGTLESSIRRISTKLEKHLGLYFHRFLENGNTNIYIDKQEQGEEENAIRKSVEPLNPFPKQNGHKDYPSHFRFDLGNIGAIRAQAHIWPPNSKNPNYKIQGSAASAQGFYIYRNDRLIQAGGWNGIVDDDREPHGSLARVRIDLPPSMDKHFSLNVQKAAVTPPSNFVHVVKLSKGDNGHTFPKYRSTADAVYRTKDVTAINHLPLVPCGGLPSGIKTLAEDVLASSTDEFRDVKFTWKKLMSEALVEIDRNDRVIYLNTMYRKSILGNRKAKVSDVPLLKMLIFMQTQSYFDKKMSAKQKNNLAQLNKLLAGCAKLGEG